MPDGSGPIQFAISTPTEDCAAHIQHALSLGLPEADASTKVLNLIANGPTAARVDLQSLPGDTMAINGALSLFGLEGPTYWIACDPQTEVCKFLQYPPLETIYFAASKCHPAVFDMLRGRDVRLWHINDIQIPGKHQVPCAVSVTICAMLLAQRLGYRTINVYGWDCCYDGEKHHAGEGALSVTPQRIQIEVGDPPDALYFDSNPTWCCEVNDARGVLPVLRWAGTDVKIHGRSMIAAILPEFAAHG